MPSLAARTRAAVRARPFLYDALRAGVVNYTAAARTLDIEGETEAIATALRRYAEELPDDAGPSADARVTMQSGVGVADAGTDPLLTVGDTAYAEGGDATAIVATGDLGIAGFERLLGTLRAEEIAVEAAGYADGHATLVVGRREGPDAVRVVESALA